MKEKGKDKLERWTEKGRKKKEGKNTEVVPFHCQACVV
jgi:hypothetical protein